MPRDSTDQVLRELFEELAPAVFANFGTVGVFEECCLLGENQIGAFSSRYKFERGLRGRKAVVPHGHRVSEDDQSVARDFQKNGVVGTGGMTAEAKLRRLAASDS